MRVEEFARELPSLFGGDLQAEHPVDRRFRAVVDDVEGMSTEHILTVLNAAAAHLGPDEWYLEVGSYRGRSLVGASLGQEHSRFMAIENFREFGEGAELAHATTLENLQRWGVRDSTRFLRGEAFRLLPRVGTPGPVGVYFYDGAHSRLAQYLGLAYAEPHLADEAVVVVDDATWPQVARSTESYVRAHPGYELLYDIRAETDYDPRWCNGLKVYAWRRPPQWRPVQGLDVRWRRIAHLYGQEPVMHLAWRTVPRMPRLEKALRVLYSHGGTSVPRTDP
jgi:predicted O-methyltransferase YrrM